MAVKIIKPQRPDKDLGAAYNSDISALKDGDFACVCDLDTCFLTSDAGTILENYASKYPEAGLFTCLTNRLHELAFDQLYAGRCSENTDIRHHMNIAEQQKRFLYNVTRIHHVISGFLMMFSKATWNRIKFKEGQGCLGIDNAFSQEILNAGLPIYRMDALYLFHIYRLKNGVSDKTHLR